MLEGQVRRATDIVGLAFTFTKNTKTNKNTENTKKQIKIHKKLAKDKKNFLSVVIKF